MGDRGVSSVTKGLLPTAKSPFMEVIKCKKKGKPPSEFEPKSPGKPHSHTYVLHQLIQVGLITSVRQYLISYSTPKLWIFQFNLCISDASSSYLFHCANIKCCWHEREPGNRVNRLKEMTPLRNEGSESCDPVQPQDGTQFNLRMDLALAECRITPSQWQSQTNNWHARGLSIGHLDVTRSYRWMN